MTDTAENYRDNRGRFSVGNPGKPYGAVRKGNAKGREALAAVQATSSLAILKLRELVDRGDFSAIRFVLEYTLPRGGRTIEINSTDPMAYADAMSEGDISPMECATAAQAMVKLNEAGEIAELAKRIAELEALIAENRNRR